MQGKNHLIAGTACGMAVCSGVCALSKFPTGNIFTEKIQQAGQWCVGYGTGSFLSELPVWASVSICFVLFVLGTLLPDIDSENSILGRFVHLPISHRTITHTLWICALFGVLSIWVRPLLYLALGYFIHVLLDAFSVCGICWVWPITRYRTFADGGMAKKHFFKLYRVGGTSEIVFTVCVTVLMLGIVFVCLPAFSWCPEFIRSLF